MENTKNQKKDSILKSIIVMRHGERIDCVDSKSNQLLSEYDPELTEKGIKQSKDIAKQIQKSLKKEIKYIYKPFYKNFNDRIKYCQKIKFR